MSIATATGHEHTGARTVAIDAWGAAGGLIFAAILVVQNIIRSGAPGFGAGPAQVSAYFLHHRVAALVPLGLFPLGMFALYFFIAAIWTTSDRQPSRWWASVGALGATTVAALFAIVNITEIVLTAKAAQLASSPDVVQAVWALHAAAFGLDLGAIAVALIGLSRAAASVRLIPGWMAGLALPGAACLLVAAVFTVALTNGGPWVAVGLVGFVVWIVFVVTASIALLRRRAIS
jgi:hypothetical protein